MFGLGVDVVGSLLNEARSEFGGDENCGAGGDVDDELCGDDDGVIGDNDGDALLGDTDDG